MIRRYPSNIIVDNDAHKTACVWIDYDHSDDAPWSALKVHLPSFATEKTHAKNWYCKDHPSVMQFHNKGDPLYRWSVDTKTRELTNGTEFFDEFTGELSEQAFEPPEKKRSLPLKRSAAMASQIVVSKDAQHSAKELCESATSHGPDFVSVPEKLFCDMGTKTLWLFCENDEDEKPCFDLDTKLIRGANIVGRDTASVGYARVTEWE